MVQNYKQRFAIQKNQENKIAENFDIKPYSGIYVFERRLIYVGKAGGKNGILQRVAQHCLSHGSHLDNSIHKHGLSCDKQGGWDIKVECYCPPNELNQKETETIDKYLKENCFLYNIESGGQSGKTDINQRAERKGYNIGVKTGYERAIKEIGETLRKYCNEITPKQGKVAERKTAELKEKLGIGDSENVKT